MDQCGSRSGGERILGAAIAQNRRSTAGTVNLRTILLFVGLLALLTAAALLVREVSWRRSYPLAQPQAAAPDAAFVAEVRSLPDSPLLAPQSSGVFVRGRWARLRSLHPQLVFVGACDKVDTRWMSRRRLVIECELRSGEPRLLQALVQDVVIELVIQPHFAGAAPDAAAVRSRAPALCAT
jgi:hypothetical protein